ncbi:T-complex protein 1 subunit theta-like 2 [Canis lupus baileyi]|uniref:Chaperonin containing TCP1 subunit 8 like 2 n=2 Tax=Canis lupus familiaris TaxID=9615 RepID=A0A8C0S1S6_CANLF|nr:T-complex protein 1 subunit theta-like 2 [Canis lupus dingo]XP_038415149.1 T-complex protein 1 subunit theta-like 2 [Canis lupus familiaris]XP_038544837.1 T-complex protein 1 subunit theta-like 2 [Canis lupus familiaris]XP_539926.1 T-complex protein 1 subunit theta-like 2 [Canis lupus familiaris]|eukprot:XP_539926.1 T-complex protein 1 subunit theta-like 2 [Canis lupus familiaris]
MAGGATAAPPLPERLGPGPRRRARGPGAQEEHLLCSVPAAQTLARVIRPCYGPHGRQKLLVTARGTTVFTGSAAAILQALELEHPAARLLREAAHKQAESCGDGAAFVVLLAEALLQQAEHLLRAGLPRSQLREAYAAATAEVLALLPSLSIRSLGPLEDPFWALYSVMNTHSASQMDYLTKLVAHACWATKELDGSFHRERVGVCTLRGGRLEDSCLLPGMALAAKPCGQVISVLHGARVALFVCAFGPASPNAPATARLSSSADLTKFRKGSEQLIEKQVAQLVTASINVVVVWGNINENTLTLADKYGIMVIQARSRRDMVYLSEVLGTPLMPYLIPPLKPGKCQRVYQQDLGEGMAVVFEWECPATPALTIALRGATAEGLKSAEQAAYHGIDAYFQLCQDPRLLPGAGATEMALAKILSEKGSRLEGLNGPAFLAFAQALQSLPETLAENAGLVVSEVMAEMKGAHQAGNLLVGVGVEGIINVTQEGVWDTLVAKAQGLRAVADVALQLVNVDEIIVAKKSPMCQQDSNPVPKKAKECLSPVKKSNPWNN